MPVEECLFTGDAVFILRIRVRKNNLLLVFIRSDDLVLLERVFQSYSDILCTYLWLGPLVELNQIGSLILLRIG